MSEKKQRDPWIVPRGPEPFLQRVPVWVWMLIAGVVMATMFGWGQLDIADMKP